MDKHFYSRYKLIQSKVLDLVLERGDIKETKLGRQQWLGQPYAPHCLKYPSSEHLSADLLTAFILLFPLP